MKSALTWTLVALAAAAVPNRTDAAIQAPSIDACVPKAFADIQGTGFEALTVELADQEFFRMDTDQPRGEL